MIEAFHIDPWDTYEVHGPHVPNGWDLRVNATWFILVIAPGFVWPKSIATVDCRARKLSVLTALDLTLGRGLHAGVRVGSVR